MRRRTFPLLLQSFPRHGIFGCLVLLCLLIFSSPVKAAPGESSTNAPVDWVFEATNHLGQWIWDTNTFDKQTARFTRPFEVPAGTKVTSAILHITVDNGYTLFIDGAEIGRGSDWRTVTEYDVTELLGPGRHVVGVEGFNDRLEGGLIFWPQSAYRIVVPAGGRCHLRQFVERLGPG